MISASRRLPRLAATVRHVVFLPIDLEIGYQGPCITTIEDPELH